MASAGEAGLGDPLTWFTSYLGTTINGQAPTEFWIPSQYVGIDDGRADVFVLYPAFVDLPGFPDPAPGYVMPMFSTTADISLTGSAGHFPESFGSILRPAQITVPESAYAASNIMSRP